MSLPTEPLARALVAALKADAPYMALIPGGLHDGTAPKGTPFAYSTLDSILSGLEATHDKDGYSHVLTFSDWSELEGSAECLGIASARDAVLEGLILTPAGWGATSLRFDFSSVLTQEDAELQKTLRHGIVRYVVSTLEA